MSLRAVRAVNRFTRWLRCLVCGHDYFRTKEGHDIFTFAQHGEYFKISACRHCGDVRCRAWGTDWRPHDAPLTLMTAFGKNGDST